MKLALIDSRTITAEHPENNLAPFLPDNVTEIVSGGAKGANSVQKISEQFTTSP